MAEMFVAYFTSAMKQDDLVYPLKYVLEMSIHFLHTFYTCLCQDICTHHAGDDA